MTQELLTTEIETLEPQALQPQAEDLPLFLNVHEALELSRCEGVVEQGLAAFLDVGQALWNIRQSRLYRESYGTFEEYVEQRWHMSKSSAYRAISATEIVQQIEAAGSPIGEAGEHLLPANEAQARPLAQLPEHQRAEAWAAAVEKAGGQPTAAVVQEVVTGMLPAKPEKADAAVAPLFDVENDAAGQKDNLQSRFVPPSPAPLNAQGDNPKPEDMTAGNLSDEEWEASTKPKSAAEPLDETAAAIDHVEFPPAQSSPAAKPPAPTPPKTEPKPEPATVPVAPALPAGFTTAIVKEEDYKAAMERGLWPLASVLETVTELEENIKALEMGELSKALVEASPSVPLYPPPSPAMVVAGVSASRLAEINATAGTILRYSETQLLDELFPERETTGPDHIVAVLVTARLREMSGQTNEDDN